jgi:hypothetical protein
VSLSALNHIKLAAQASTLTVVSALDALYAAATATVDYEGTSVTAGAGLASMVKNVARYQNVGVTEAVYGEFQNAAMAGVKWIFAGQDVATLTPTMRTPDTFVAGQIICQIVRNAGVFNAWDNVAPFTSGQGFGYWRCAIATSVNSVELYSSQDTVWVSWLGVADTTCHACGMGALWDPDTTSVSASELSGRRIGVITGGSSILDAFVAGGFLTGHHTGAALTNDAISSFCDHNTTNGGPHAGVLKVPTLSTIDTVCRDGWMRPASDGNYASSSGVLDDGRIVRRMLGVHVVGLVSTTFYTANTVGKLRDISCNPIARSGAVLDDGATHVAYAIGDHHITSGNVLLLHA